MPCKSLRKKSALAILCFVAAHVMIASGLAVVPIGFHRSAGAAETINGAGATFPFPLYSKWFYEYKKIDPNAQFNYQYGNLVYDNWGFIMWSDGAFGSLNQIQKQLGRWQKPGDITNIPKYIYGNTNNSNAESSRWYYKGDFIRLRELTLSYQIPKKLTQKAKMDNVQFYVRGTNLWTKAFDKNIPFDPEQGFSGTNNLQVLIQRTIAFGVTIGL